MRPTVNDFFCGAGGISLGFMGAGYDVIWACDFDKYAIQTYRRNVGDHVVQANIKELKWKGIPYADVWAFGFPCQDLSVAGKQKGFRFTCRDCGEEWSYDSEKDCGEIKCPKCGSASHQAATRSGVFFEVMRLLDEMAAEKPEYLPKALLIENVKGLKPYIPALENELQRRGYTAYIQLYNSKYWGVPQNRERYFIIGLRDNAKGFEFPEEQHEVVPKLSTALDTHVDEKYYIADEKAQTIIKQALERLETLGKVHPTMTPNFIKMKQRGPRAKADEKEMYTLMTQFIHGIIVREEELSDIMQGICRETGLLSPDNCGRALCVGGRGALSKKHNYQHIIVARKEDDNE